MPIYEYRCPHCRRRSSVLVRNYAPPSLENCPLCGRPGLVRVISSFAVLKSEESRLEDMADPSRLGDVDENDPRSVARWMRQMGKDVGEDLGPEFDEMVGKMEAGEMPDEFPEGEESLGDDLD
ncbi:MAG: zinc ribbon domain-containing protein [Chloroflexi bacterium]|nr:zinc ribbon domain-containing protein [Chloroflexota bacterium]